MSYVLYDYLAPIYDPVFHTIYAPYRRQALEHLTLKPGDTVLDLACGTGQNFPLLAPRLTKGGTILGIDISSGVLRRAAAYAEEQQYCGIKLLHTDATALGEGEGNLLLPGSADAVICTYGFSSMPRWKTAFDRSFTLLKPGGTYLIHDIHAKHRNPHSAFVEMVTRTDLSIPYWQALEEVSADFTLQFLPRTRLIFGGSLFIATGKKRQIIP
ncbi:MAG TPA: class I SAM-dependent methyltransferase [Candidatus Methylacidiphilales bacterium]|nr:class I SAM-dependent methyltransferase [Candidatus Methylacidiphilales bacterium]